jgi:hypothetical protein
MRKTNAHPGNMLERFLHTPAADNLVLEALGLVEQTHETRLELVGQELTGRAHINDRRWPLV